MSKYLIIFVFFSIFITEKEALTKNQFKTLLYGISDIIYYLEHSNYSEVDKILKLSSLAKGEEIKTILNNHSINFSKRDDSIYIFPSFQETTAPNELLLTITAFKSLPKKANEDFPRGKYFYVIKTIVQFDTDSNTYKYRDLIILTENKEINCWWQSQYKTYVTNTKLIHDRYDYIPPPPSPPPEN